LADAIFLELEEKSQTPSGIFAAQKPRTPSEELSLTRISRALSAKLPLSWSHYLFLMGISHPEKRRFYELEAAQLEEAHAEWEAGKLCI